MALYKYADNLKKNEHGNFGIDRTPGTETPDAGIYRCTGCKDEIGIAKDHKLSPQNHHQHSNGTPVR